ncbi:hypothetical protein ACFUJU_28800 [Streptomyces sp. NPDC057235]|uniref:hypothetical protein n=1 Tax=Streptomyces sp. NPDC057235 TaxID=3346058 RepID=UPI003624C0D0
MPRGGARAVSGPPPDPRSLRSAKVMDKGGWRTLPAEGRQAPAPEWPLTTPSDRELDLWDELWAKPQAVAWADMGQELEVGLFVRTLAEAESPDARLDVKKMVRSYLDSLGLSVAGMNRNRWKIAPAIEEAEPEGPAVNVEPARRPSARDRFRVVTSGEGS